MNVIGVDLGIHKVGLAVFTTVDFGFSMSHAFAHEVDPDAPRDMQLGELAFVVSNTARLHEVSSVWIEDVIVGNNRKYSLGLAQTLGAVLGVMSSVRLAEGTDVRVVGNKTWKRDVVGNGNAKKSEIREYIDVTHPAYAALCGDDQDLYDASCVGLYGLGILNRAQQLSL